MADAVKVQTLIAQLATDNERWRLEAERELVSLGAASVPALLGALEHASAAARLHAVHALARLREPRALAPLATLLSDAENRGAVAIAAEHALVAFGAVAVDLLLEAGRAGGEAGRARAIRALGQIGDLRARGALEAWVSDPSAAIRAQAAVALGAVAGPAAVEAIAPLLSDEDERVQWAAAEALTRAGCVRGEAVLQKARAMADDPLDVRWAEELLEEITELRRTGRALA